MSKPQAIIDLECYPNYFLILFQRLSDNQTIGFERTEEKSLDCGAIRAVINKYELISFNGNKYDIPMLRLALTGVTNDELKAANDDIIHNEVRLYLFERTYAQMSFGIDHIDLIEVAPGMTSLKTYGGRLHCNKIQDLPIEPDTVLTSEQMALIKEYCGNDTDTTRVLYEKLKPQIDLRRQLSRQYGLDLRSKSDAQIAEEVIKSELTKLKRCRLPKPDMSVTSFRYDVPSFIEFESPALNSSLTLVTGGTFNVFKQSVAMPKELEGHTITIGRSTYRMGIGGLHSTEQSVFYKSDKHTSLMDWDVTSYYPSIILNSGLYPEHLGEDFMAVYRSLVEQRIKAKARSSEIHKELNMLRQQLTNLT